MESPSTNPYSPPATTDSVPLRAPSADLRPLWIWLVIAAVVSFLGTPADPVSMIIALIYGLSFFCVGSILASSMHVVLRVLPLMIWVTPAIWLAGSFREVYFFIGATFYALLSITLGYWAHRSIRHGRTRILAAFYVGYALGSLFGILGTVAGAVLGASLAKLSLPAVEVPEDSQLSVEGRNPCGYVKK